MVLHGKPKQQASTDLSERELRCLIENVYFESRNQPLAGQAGVAFVTLNRVKAPGYPKTVCEVVWQKTLKDGRWIPQFSWTLDGESDAMTELDAIARAVDVALAASRGLIPDPSGGALNFYNPDLASPSWERDIVYRIRIRNHDFVQLARR
jgi:spore germination cell wall hydrolase CwlJ-like protein